MKRDANFKTILNSRKTIKTVWIALNLICLILSLIGAASAQTQEKHYVTLEDGRRYPVEAPEIVHHRIEEAKRQAQVVPGRSPAATGDDESRYSNMSFDEIAAEVWDSLQ